MEDIYARLARQLGQIGLTLSIWDGQRRRVDEFPACELCRVVRGGCEACSEAAGELAGRILADGKPARASSPLGCCIIGVPVLRRRRLLGAAVACFPVRGMLEEESLARVCDRFHLDRKVVASLAGKACRHDAEQAEDLLRVLNWLLKGERDLAVARKELGTLSLNLTSTYEELSLMYRISGLMKVTQQPEQFIDNVCEELLEVMNISGAVAVIDAYGAQGKDRAVVAGSIELSDREVKRLMTVHAARQFGKDFHPIVENQFDEKDGELADRGITSLIAVPLVVEDRLIGAIIGLNKCAGEFDSIDIKLIGSIGHQAEVFLANHRLYADLQDLLMGVLHALTESIDAKDPYTSGHSRRVALVSKRLAEASGFPPEKVQQLYLGGLLHDIGKIGVPESILCKEGRLTAEEYDNVKKHPVLGAKILGGIRQLDDVLVGILYHHERPDGKGYPHGLKGDEIPYEGQIIGLADAFDAMTSDRTYRKALPLADAITEIRTHAGEQFDENLVRVFLSIDLEEFSARIRQPAEGVLQFPFGQEAQR